MNAAIQYVKVNERRIQATQEDVRAISDLIVAVYKEEKGEQ